MNGSIYDLAAMYALLIEGEVSLKSKDHNGLLRAISNILDNGYTYEDISNEIMTAFKTKEMFPFYKFKKHKENGNLLKSNIRYYHKQLNLMSQLKPVVHDIDNGTITSQGNEYWIEPRASYTANDLADYMYSKGIMNGQEFPLKRLTGLIGSFIKQYGIEITLFMVEHCARVYEDCKEQFSLNKFSTYHSIAKGYLEEIKNNCVYSGGLDYVPRKRMLSD